MGGGKRTTASRLINCPFEIWGKKRVDGIWWVVLKNISHNHVSLSDMSGHPSCRQFSKEEIEQIKEMTIAGIPPRQILTSLQQSNQNLQAIARTLYNAKAKIRNESLLGRTPIQALFEDIGQGGFIYDFKHDKSGHLTHLFFAHPLSVALTNSYSYVFLMDCTYKTNRYKMPLLDIVGVTSFNTSFYSCFAFLQREEEEDYVWALETFGKFLGVDGHPLVIVSDRELALMNAIQVVFPRTTHLLCVWHIEKNVLSKCKSQFEEKEEWDMFLSTWTYLIKSPDESTFDTAWKLLEIQYKEKVFILNYLRNTWLPFKEKFVYAWTVKYMHFGNHVTSRAEGAHAMLKKYLQVSIGDFREVKGKICLAIENQFQEIKARLCSEKVHIQYKFHIPLFKELVTHVSIHALGEIFKQYELATSATQVVTCRGHFSNTMGLPCAGLPCAHKIRVKKDGTLELDDIHQQWGIDIRSFTNIDGALDSEGVQIDCLLKEFHEKIPTNASSPKGRCPNPNCSTC
ncbi:protein FAR1-RELATED SEQUENCE 5-like [Tasmannia lanceolata]|uniref:protein FAR1-RELATED SEQUENCE 5-like n=1 Tax=Tasmannia lanceolata TaxID=3420 RepID=UPI00406400F4